MWRISYTTLLIIMLTMRVSSVKSLLVYYESLASYLHDFYISKLLTEI